MIKGDCGQVISLGRAAGDISKIFCIASRDGNTFHACFQGITLITLLLSSSVAGVKSLDLSYKDLGRSQPPKRTQPPWIARAALLSPLSSASKVLALAINRVRREERYLTHLAMASWNPNWKINPIRFWSSGELHDPHKRTRSASDSYAECVHFFFRSMVFSR